MENENYFYFPLVSFRLSIFNNYAIPTVETTVKQWTCLNVTGQRKWGNNPVPKFGTYSNIYVVFLRH